MAILSASAILNNSNETLIRTTGTLINQQVLEYSTRVALSTSADTSAFSVTYNKILGATQSNLVIKADIRGRGSYSGVCGCYLAVSGNRNYHYTHFYDNGAQEIIMWQGIATWTGYAAGSLTITAGWSTQDGGSGNRPFDVLNPDQGDGDARFRKQTSRITVWEVAA